MDLPSLAQICLLCALIAVLIAAIAVLVQMAIINRAEGFNVTRRAKLSQPGIDDAKRAQLLKWIRAGEKRIARTRRQVGQLIPTMGIIAIISGAIGIFQYVQASRVDDTLMSSFPEQRASGISPLVKVTAQSPRSVQLGDSEVVQLLLTTKNRLKCRATSYSVTPIALRTKISPGVRVRAPQCSVQWQWIVTPLSGGTEPVLFSIETSGNKSGADASSIPGPTVLVEAKDKISVRDWTPWVIALLGGIATLVNPIASLFGRAEDGKP